ncbi:tyrosine-type recombinase/integrase [Agrococcus sp. TF02-05]|uniref:tyrosine-type recombinase/integrase n=1 Tax=Agrococcus sp. TF02-05 TaxID=2815211 RepID=UPI001AA14BDD|nr:tyrosine-type recombinase/integrase [Agrococcus sp. TF02-05]MBO1770447.1 tyrosine-type recombinase/integrase [Agrococcus sp. TF02-05]
MTSRVIHPDWPDTIAAYLHAQAAAGRPPSTRETRRQHLTHLARRVESGPWALTSAQLAAYLGAQGWARETLRGRRITLQSFYRWAIASGCTEHDPTEPLERIAPGRPNPRPVPDDVYLEALWRADDTERLWIDLAAEHGLRRAEIAGIHARDLVPTLLGYDLRVHGKGGKPRIVPLTSPMASALLALAEHGGWLWPGEEMGHVSARWLGKRVNRLLPGDWTIHKLRHRAATRFWVHSGGDPYVVADLMGWANLAMVRTYVALPSDRLRSVVERASRAGERQRVG